MKNQSSSKRSQSIKTRRPTALVTGASRGIGKAIANEFSKLGYDLILTGTDSEKISKLNENCDENVKYIVAEFAEPSSIQQFTSYLNTVEQLDACINCAGINIIKPIDKTSSEDLQKILNVNYVSAYEICKASTNIMKKNGGGRIVNIASIWSVISKEHRSLYSGTKAALAGMTRALAVELAQFNILVNCVSPGFVFTDLTRESLTGSQLAELTEIIPVKRLAMPEEIAKIVVFLAGEDNTYLTGQNIIVDGGVSIACQ